MATSARKFRHEEFIAPPRGSRVRTVTRGGHRIRLAFPAGPRRRGAGEVVSVLHPKGERNPVRALTAADVKAGRVWYLDLTDRFGGRHWFVGPMLAEDAEREAQEYRKAGIKADSISAPPGFQAHVGSRRTNQFGGTTTGSSLVDSIRHGDRVTIVDRFGQQRSGRAVMVARGGIGWVLNMGGPHGTPGIATPENVVRVRHANPAATGALARMRELAWAASIDAANRSMRKAGRKAWNEEDYQAAVDEFNRLWPEERDIEMARQRFERGNPVGIGPWPSGFQERWDSAKLGHRVEWAKASGWVTKTGELTRLGEKIAESKWANLSPAAQNVLRATLTRYLSSGNPGGLLTGLEVAHELGIEPGKLLGIRKRNAETGTFGGPISMDPADPEGTSFAPWRASLLKQIYDLWMAGKWSKADYQFIRRVTGLESIGQETGEPGFFDWSFVRDADDSIVEAIAARLGITAEENPQYSGDPRWLTAKYGGKCRQCGREIRPGEQIFYYPRGKHVLCEGEACGRQAAREFEAAAADERMMSGNPPRKVLTREQLEKRQAKAVRFLRDVVGDSAKADEIARLSLEEYAAKKKVTLGNPGLSRLKKGARVRVRRLAPGLKHSYPLAEVKPGTVTTLLEDAPAGGLDVVDTEAGSVYAFQLELVRGQNPRAKGRALTVPGKHQLRIARDSLKMPDAMLGVMGGPSKAEAREIIFRLIGRRSKENPLFLPDAWAQASPAMRIQLLSAVGTPGPFALLSWHRLPVKVQKAIARAAAGRASPGSVRLTVRSPEGKEYSQTKRLDTQVAAFWPRGRTVGNPEAAAGLYESFHGRPAAEVLEFQAARAGVQTGLGQLRELVSDLPNGKRLEMMFTDADRVLVTSNAVNGTRGTQLYFVGGNQDISSLLEGEDLDVEKDTLNLGRARQITYRGQKRFDNFETIDYVHKFGEGGKEKPVLLYDRLGKNLSLAGGEYEIQAPGIMG